MSRVSDAGASSGVYDPTADALANVDIDAFLELFIAELQNQDPLNPMDNAQMVEQISQIREVGATDKLTNTLEAVLLGQNLASATNLIGQNIVALDDEGNDITGKVDKITVTNGEPKLHVGDSEISITNVREILSTDDLDNEDA